MNTLHDLGILARWLIVESGPDDVARRGPMSLIRPQPPRVLQPGDVIKPGMTFAFEPNACLGRRRVNIGGTVVATERGCEELNEICNWMVRVPA